MRTEREQDVKVRADQTWALPRPSPSWDYPRFLMSAASGKFGSRGDLAAMREVCQCVSVGIFGLRETKPHRLGPGDRARPCRVRSRERSCRQVRCRVREAIGDKFPKHF